LAEAATQELILTLTPSNDLEGPNGAVAEAAEWVRRARAGDGEAFALLVDRHERMVLRTALRLLGRLDLAQDAAQDAFLRLHRHLRSFDESRELGPWLYRVVVNVCRDMSRRSSSPRLLGLDEVGEVRDARHDPARLDDALALAEQRRVVQAALLTLPLKEREAIVLRDIEGLATSEVARILGSSEGTVRSQISTGRLKIKRYVEARRGGVPGPAGHGGRS
jgi:RNA polymerase sigma factor (sigma-70 family)